MKPGLFSKGSLSAWLEHRIGPARAKIATYNSKGVRSTLERDAVDRALIERQKVSPIGHQYDGWNSLVPKKPLQEGIHVSIPIKGKREIFEMRLPGCDLPPLTGKLENGAIEVFLVGKTPGELQASLDAWTGLLEQYLARANQLIDEHNRELVAILRETLRQRHEAIASRGADYHYGPRG